MRTVERSRSVFWWAGVAFILHGIAILTASTIRGVALKVSIATGAGNFMHSLDRPIRPLDRWLQDTIAYHLGPVYYPKWWPLSPYYSAVVIDGLIHLLIGGIAYAAAMGAVAWAWNSWRSRR